MKISRLFVLGALGLFSLSVNAADLIERYAPEEPDWIVDLDAVDRTPCEFKVGEVYVLYNVDADMFYYRGNAWDSQATGSYDNALPVRFVMPDGMSLNDKALYLRDYCDRYARWRTAFITVGDSRVNGVFGDDTPALFTDNNDGLAALLWVESAGNNVYKLCISEKNTVVQPEGLYFGIDPDSPGVGNGESGTVINPKATVEVNQTWQLFALPEMTEYFVAYDIYLKAEGLKALIEKAEEKGVDVSAAANVYNNENSTMEQIEAAMSALQQALAGGIGNGTAENPKDATSVINNPDFNGASSSGWSGSKPNMVGSGAHGPANVAEFYQGDNINMYQELNGIPAGVYRLTMYGFYRSGNTATAYQNFLDNANYRAKLYATVDGEMLTTDIVNPFEIQNKESFAGPTDWGVNGAEASSNGFLIPNDPSCARVYFNQGWYQNTLFFYVSGDNAIIGVREDGSHFDADWFLLDEFRLTYYGNSEASFGKWVELSAPDFSNMKVTKSLLDDFQSNLQGLIASATDKASALAAVEQFKPLVDVLKANAALWTQYIAKLNEAMALANSEEYADYGGDISDYMMDAEDYINALELTSDEIEAEMAKIDRMIAEMKQAAATDIRPGRHLTHSWFTNCDFASGNEGWTIANNGCYFGYGVAEAYGRDFDIHQEYTPAMKGVYQLDLQAFFRTARGNNALNSYLNGEQTCDAAVYIGTADATNRTKVKCVFSEVIDPELVAGGGNFLADGSDWMDGNYYANDLQGVNTAFQAGMYKNTAYGIVKNEGETIRIGVGGKLGGTDWICFDNFDLIYLGYEDPTANAYLIDLAIEELNGMDLLKPMGKSVKAEVNAAIAAANNAVASGNGAAMFDVLSDLYDMKAKIEASQALFAELTQLIEDVMVDLNNSENPQAIEDAGNVAFEIQQGMDNFMYEDADVPALKLRLEKALTALRIPDVSGASKSNPVDLTAVILSADYGNEDLMEWDDYGDLVSLGNSTKGWEGDAGNFGNDELQMSAYAYEFWNKPFDHYQTLYGMPAGYYEVEVTAFNRFGSNGMDIQAFRNGTQNTAYLYAETGDQQNTAPLPFLAACGGEYEINVDGEVVVTLDAEGNETQVGVVEGFYRPGSLLSAKGYLDVYEDVFRNKVKVKVGDDGFLRIGIRKTENQNNGWCVMDDWRLYYLGTNDVIACPSGDVNDDGVVDIADVASLDNDFAAGKALVDVNGDEYSDWMDISAIISKMTSSEVQDGNADGKTVLTASTVTLSYDDITANLDIYMDYDTNEAVTALAFSLYLPEGLSSISRVEPNAAVLADKSLEMKRRNDGGYLIICHSTAIMNSTHGKLLSLKLRTTGKVNGSGYIKGISLASSNGVSLDLGNIADATFDVVMKAPENLFVDDWYILDWLDDTDADYKPDVTINGNGVLTVEGNSTLSMGQFTINYWPSYDRWDRASLLNNATMRADNVGVGLILPANRWEFLTFPFDVKVSDIRPDNEGLPFAIRKYDGQKRADGLTAETWVDMTADSILHAGQGYIWRSPAIYDQYNGFSINALQTVNKNNIFANDDVEVPLAYYESERGYNRSWNLIGNPYPCYYDTRAMQTSAPITVWDVYAQDYRAYSPLDDCYILTPGEAFFVQRPVDEANITFLKEGRQGTPEVRDINYHPAGARSLASTASRNVFNVTISSEGQSDRTRFVINADAALDYEPARDASKFQSLENTAMQLYTLENGMRYSINERPLGNGTISLGMKVATDGLYTITLDTKVAREVTLIDRLTGQEVRLDGNAEGYTFVSEAGTFNSRFAITLGGEATGIADGYRDMMDENHSVYDLQGRRVDNVKKGIYVVNGKKSVVK